MRWLEPLLTGFCDISPDDLTRLGQFESHLTCLLAEYPVTVGAGAAGRSAHLSAIRQSLAASGHLALAVPARYGGCGRPAILQPLLQFICGYYDIDLRDSTGLGHGRLIAVHATPQVRDRWLPALLAGAIPGIAITEPHGGSQVRATRTRAVPASDSAWRVTGTKTWISRLDEASVFVVFFTDPAGRLTTAAVDAAAPGITRLPLTPVGLSGWAWGELHFEEVTVWPYDILSHPGDGMRLLREHFAYYRPLVAATALGAAAAVHDQISDLLSQRHQAGIIATVRDNALITLGRTFASINAAILAALVSCRLSGDTHPAAELWGCAVKAHGVDTAYQAASELALLAGASGFVADSRTAKTRRDLNALLYADGIHDSLLRSAGRALTLIRNYGTRSVTPPSRSPAIPPYPQRGRPGRPRPAGRSAATPGQPPRPTR
jgi:alkylation response protein AidB-like acyl-CoA dehydrogenase